MGLRGCVCKREALVYAAMGSLMTRRIAPWLMTFHTASPRTPEM